MANKIRQGPAREFLFGGMSLDPAEGSELSYYAQGRSGTIHMAGNGQIYMESNPHPGSIKQDVSVDGETFKKLKDIQSAGSFLPVSVTTPGNELLTGEVGIGNDGPIENANGIVSLELYGKVRID
jgi:hypothetical protein